MSEITPTKSVPDASTTALPAAAKKKGPLAGTKQGKTIYEMNIERQKTRDLAVMRYLASGFATNEQVYNDLFKKEDGKKVHRSIFNDRMRELCRQGIVKKHKYMRYTRSGPTTLYALGDVGMEEVVNKFGLEPQFIRNEFPSVDKFKHEVMLAGFVRIVRREEELKKYQIGYIYDDRIIRSMIPAAEWKKTRGKILMPDLRMEVLPHYKDNLMLNIELDTGKKREDYWKRKLRVWTDNTLVLTLDSVRLNMLIKIMRKLGLQRTTGLALASDFAKYGLVGTKWTWFPGEKDGVLDIGKIELH